MRILVAAKARPAGDRRPVREDRRHRRAARRRAAPPRSATTASGCCTRPGRHRQRGVHAVARRLRRAKRILDAYERATSVDRRGAVMLDGEMIDEASRKLALCHRREGGGRRLQPPAGWAPPPCSPPAGGRRKRLGAPRAVAGVKALWSPSGQASQKTAMPWLRLRFEASQLRVTMTHLGRYTANVVMRAVCPRCRGQAHAPTAWSSAWRCDLHGEIHPLAPARLPPMDGLQAWSGRRGCPSGCRGRCRRAGWSAASPARATSARAPAAPRSRCPAPTRSAAPPTC